MTSDEILIGVGLTFALAVGSQILAHRLRIPAIVVLLPVGFAAGAITDNIVPTNIVGSSFQPLVSLAVALILFDSGVELDLRRLTGSTRSVVTRLIVLGVPITWAIAGAAAGLFLGLSFGAASMIGAIIVVSGPTVVAPLLSFIRPTARLRTILAWESSVIDPIGGILGALVFHAVVAGGPGAPGYELGQFLASVGVGAAGGVVGTAVLWLLLKRFRLSEILGATGTLATVIAVAAACDVIRDDTGLFAAILMGLAIANLPVFDIPARRPFFGTVIQLMIGLLFISISSTVTPDSVGDVLLPTLGLVAVLVLVARPLVAYAATVRTDLSTAERAFIGWMDPRGIVAAATASAFSATLVTEGVRGASDILPATFLVIVGTVMVYGLTAAPVARRLGVSRPAASLPLIVGGTEWVVALARALRAQRLDVLMWAGSQEQRERIQQAGLALAPGRLVADATGRGAELEGITTVLLLTEEDDFNALAAVALDGTLDGGVYRVAAPSQSVGVVAPFTRGEILFGATLTGEEIARRHGAGAEFIARTRDQDVPDGAELLFVLRSDGRLDPVTATTTPDAEDHDTLVLLGPSPQPRGMRTDTAAHHETGEADPDPPTAGGRASPPSSGSKLRWSST
jgi:NhaP-type Na+/H+ or K+/H+ antiporter